MDKKIITTNFSRCACRYDKYADVQRRAALEILGEIQGRSFDNVLEIGCGTGNYTLLLRERFKKAKITALDISDKMVEVAKDKLKDKDIEFIVGDGELADFANEIYDLITSNACFQWFENLQMALERYRGLLKKGGSIVFSVFGPLTFWELSQTLESILENGHIAANNFMDKDKISRILKRNFDKFKIKELTYSESFDSLLELLNKIKYTGVRGNGIGARNSFSLQHLNKLEKAYLDKFRRIKATYQVFACQGLAE